MSLCRKLFIPFFAIPLALAASNTELGNNAIRAEYQSVTAALVADVGNMSYFSSPEDERKMEELGYIRSKLAIPVLLPRLTWERQVVYSTNPPSARLSEKVLYGSTRVISAGPRSALRQYYPAYKSLLRIGVTLDDSIASFPLWEDLSSVFMHSCLAKLAADGYFDNLVIANARRWSLLPGYQRVEEIVLRSPRAKVFSTYECYGSQVAARYDTMQDELVSRFKSQLASGDAEIADTIYTMGFIRSDRAMPLLIDNLTICPQVSTNAPLGFVFPAAEALVSIAPPLGICFEKLDAAAPMSLEESLWLRITHEVYPEGLEYELHCAAATNDMRAVRLMKALPWRRLTEAEMSDSWSVGASADRP